MASHDYAFVTEWSFDAPIAEVAAILEDLESLPNWWPSVYLDLEVISQGREGGVGKRAKLLTKGWLPYLLRWTLTVLESNSPHGFKIDAEGDFDGQGVWTLKQLDQITHVRFDWTIRAEKPLLRRLSWLLKPIFSRNHEWAMAQGRESLALEIRRRRGEHEVPAPPQPIFRRPGRESARVRVPS